VRVRKRQAEIGTLDDLAPGGNPVHRLLGWETDAIAELIETWGPRTVPTASSHTVAAIAGSCT
jgi:hypothetical protein